MQAFPKDSRVYDKVTDRYGFVVESTKHNGVTVHFDNHEYPAHFRQESALNELKLVKFIKG